MVPCPDPGVPTVYWADALLIATAETANSTAARLIILMPELQKDVVVFWLYDTQLKSDVSTKMCRRMQCSAVFALSDAANLLRMLRITILQTVFCQGIESHWNLLFDRLQFVQRFEVHAQFAFVRVINSGDDKTMIALKRLVREVEQGWNLHAMFSEAFRVWRTVKVSGAIEIFSEARPSIDASISDAW